MGLQRWGKIPETIFVSQWIARGVPRLLASYPQKNLDPNLIIDVFGLILREEEEPREGFYIVEYPEEATFSRQYAHRNFVCYFSGMELRQLVGLILEKGEDPEPYRGALVRVALRLFRRGEIPTAEEEWEEIWSQILAYTDMPIELRIADIFRDFEARMILSIMVEEGVLTLDELIRKAREKISYPITRDLLISYVYVLSALGILEVRFDEKALIERVYLISDVVFYRRKPQKFDEIIKKFPSVKEIYIQYVSDYIATWEADAEKIPELLSNSEIYPLIQKFRQEGAIEESKLSPSDRAIAERLKEENILVKIDNTYVMLVDPAYKLLFPKWTIAKLVEKAKEDTTMRDLLKNWLNVLKEAYLRRR